jgi:hypothetical protein
VPSRERRRAELRKRKQRSAGGAEGATPGSEAPEAEAVSPRERMERGYARAEERNREVRESLEPLAEGERPTVVTLAAILSGTIAALTMGAWIAGVEVDGSRPEFIQALAPALLFGLMAWGMWRARYWAVLGFQTLLVFVLFAAAWGLATEAGSVAQVLASLGLLAVAGTFFWFMVKAMARIQMPSR